MTANPFLALATDGDGTLITRKVLARATLAALDRFRASGRKLILVTGQNTTQLEKFPAVDRFDIIVAENGAVLYWPDNKQTRVLASPPPPELVRSLRRKSVEPITTGNVIVATCCPCDRILQETLEELRLSWRVIYNRHEAMALPSGIDKSTGLCAALQELRIQAEQVVGAGDALNDVPLFRCCGLGVAVGTAVAEAKAEADLVLREGSGTGIVHLIHRILANDLPRRQKKRIA